MSGVKEVLRWQLKGFIPGVEGVSKAVLKPWVVLASDYDALAQQLAASEARENYFLEVIEILQQKISSCENNISKAVRLLHETWVIDPTAYNENELEERVKSFISQFNMSKEYD